MSSKVAIFLYFLATIAGVGVGYLPRTSLKKTEVDRELEYAIRNANIRQVDRLLSQHPNLDAKFGEDDAPALYDALREYYSDRLSLSYKASKATSITKNRYKVIEMLLDAGANPNVEKGCVSWAFAIGDWELMKLLLSHGARVRYSNEIKYTYNSMRWADLQLDSFEKCLEMAIGVGYDLNHRDLSGRTKMHAIAKSCDFEKAQVQSIVEIMVKHGLDINAKDCLGMTPYDYATSDEARKWLASHGAIPSN